MKKYLATFVCGFSGGILHNIPGAGGLFLVILPLSVFLALMLHIKANKIKNGIPISEGVIVGLLTGLFGGFFNAFFEVLITLITKHNKLLDAIREIEKIKDQFPQLDPSFFKIMYDISDSITNYGFSLIYTFGLFSFNLMIQPVIGLISGALIAFYLNNNSPSSKKL